MLEKSKIIHTTLTLPADLIKRSQHFIDGEIEPSRNVLIIKVLEKHLFELEQQEIGRQFEAMVDDKAYQAINEQISESFAESDWEALLDGETE